MKCEGRDDKADFHTIKAAMSVLNFSDDETWEIIKILASLLHIGNLDYNATVVGKDSPPPPPKINIERGSDWSTVSSLLTSNLAVIQTVSLSWDDPSSSFTY